MSSDYIRKLIEESNHIVCLCGLDMDVESGCRNIRDDTRAYAIEQRYGYSAQTIYSLRFFSVRTAEFFDFYKNEVLEGIGQPNEAHYCLAGLEKSGKLKGVVTRSAYRLAQKAGCKNVIELLGNIYDNRCPKCGKIYSVQYIKNSAGTPLCPDCNTPIRPGVCLYGEMIDNQRVTKAAELISQADVLLVLGSNLKSRLCEDRLQYYKGTKLILINELPHYSDQAADYVVYGKIKSILPNLIP